jgi:FkbM family methyltransferase
MEPQEKYAQQIARSILLNHLESKASVHNAAVSNLPLLTATHNGSGQTSFVAIDNNNIDNVVRIPTEKLDDLFASETVLFLKVDVEGFEGAVLETASELFRQERILHAVFEYTPSQFQGRGTDYKAFLPTLYTLGARTCYCCHRNKEKIFRIPRGQEAIFYDEMLRIKMQTDIYCSFGEDVNVFSEVPEWTRETSLLS